MNTSDGLAERGRALPLSAGAERPDLPVGRDEVVLARSSASFPPDLASAGAARRLLDAALEQAGRRRWSDAGALALSEVVTNAALHAHTPFEVLVEVSPDRLRVEVRDRNPALPKQRRYDAQATTGRGMALVAALTDECGVHGLGPAGKVVWFTLSDALEEQTAETLLDAWDLDGDWEELAPVSPQARPVVLEAMPVTLWLAARQHHDALLRELVLYLAGHDDVQVDVVRADSARGLVSTAVIQAVERAQQDGTARSPLPVGHPGPLPPVPDSLALTVSVTVELAGAYAALQDALDAAERLAAAGKLLARPGLPEIVAVRDWVCEQMVAQLAGVGPSPWPGTAQPHFETAVNASRAGPWPDDDVRDAERAVVAADDANRIVAVSRSLAALVGWEVDDLVGRRVVTLIPSRLREAHVAGFTRHLTTGEAHVLGVPLVLPVLHADGSELLCRFLIERAPDSTGRSVYLAWVEAEPTASGATLSR